MAYYPTPTAAAADPTTQQPAAVYQRKFGLFTKQTYYYLTVNLNELKQKL